VRLIERGEGELGCTEGGCKGREVEGSVVVAGRGSRQLERCQRGKDVESGKTMEMVEVVFSIRRKSRDGGSTRRMMNDEFHNGPKEEQGEQSP
jgi:hypothetical protein